jgi:hypothetical protein
MRITESKLRQIIREEARRLVEMAPGVAAPSITVQELQDVLFSATDGADEQSYDDMDMQTFLDTTLSDYIGARVSDLPGWTVVRFLSAEPPEMDFDTQLQHKDGSVANLSDLV